MICTCVIKQRRVTPEVNLDKEIVRALTLGCEINHMP